MFRKKIEILEGKRTEKVGKLTERTRKVPLKISIRGMKVGDIGTHSLSPSFLVFLVLKKPPVCYYFRLLDSSYLIEFGSLVVFESVVGCWL